MGIAMQFDNLAATRHLVQAVHVLGHDDYFRVRPEDLLQLGEGEVGWVGAGLSEQLTQRLQ
jgi:hypothetical protein